MLKRGFYILLFLLLKIPGISQVFTDSNYIDISAFSDSMLIVKKACLFFDSNSIATDENAARQKFVPFANFNYTEKIKVKLVRKRAYLKIPVYNNDTTEKAVFCYPGRLFDKLDVYKLLPDGEVVFYEDAAKTGFAKLRVAPGEKSVYLFSLSFCHGDFNLLLPQLIQPNYLSSYKAVRNSRTSIRKVSSNLTGGMLMIMILFVAANYFLSRRKEFLYYLGYAFFNCLLMMLGSLFADISGSYGSFYYGYLDLVLLILSGIFYLRFIRHFLETKTVYPVLEKTFKVTELCLVSLLLMFTYTYYITEWYFLEILLENLMKFILIGIGILFIIIALKKKKRLLSYLAVGNAFAIFFSIISVVLIFSRVNSPNIFLSSTFNYNLGVVFSLGSFLLGLTYKNQKELIDNLKQQAALKLDVERQQMENQISLIKAQQEERNRISADMHDDLGAGMTTIRLYSELAKNKLSGTDVPEIEKISSSANELLTKMNAIIWSMSSSNDYLGNMVAYIRSYSLEYFENTGINCKINLPEDIPNLVVTGPVRRNVFLVVKEALNNIVKHSGAKEVKITMEKTTEGLKLLIYDNGKGIDFAQLRQFSNGLKNMKKRMDDIGVEFSIENKNGTLITLYRAVPGI